MTLIGYLRLRAEGSGAEWFEYRSGLQPVPTYHPPSLKNPQEVKIPTPQDGWKKGDSKKARQQALSDLYEIHKRMRRQIGKPEIAHQALYPIYPNIKHSF